VGEIAPAGDLERQLLGSRVRSEHLVHEDDLARGSRRLRQFALFRDLLEGERPLTEPQRLDDVRWPLLADRGEREVHPVKGIRCSRCAGPPGRVAQQARRRNGKFDMTLEVETDKSDSKWAIV